MSLPTSLSDPIVFALPAFVIFMVLEMFALGFLGRQGRQGRHGGHRRDEPDLDRYRGYEARDTRTNIYMGLGSLVITGASRAAALVGYAALYAVTPLRLDAHRWYTWVLVLLLVDLLWYSYHRASHRVRLMWAGHQAHHNSQRFNLSTAVRQKWNPWFELLFWVPLPLLGRSALDDLHRVLDQPDLPVLRAHRTGRAVAGADRIRVQHSLAPPRAPRQRP